MKRSRFKISKVAGAIALAYFLFIFLFIGKSLATYRETQDLYIQFNNEGLSKEVQGRYVELLAELKDTAKVVSSPLIAPWLELVGFRDRVDRALDIYGDVSSVLPVVPNLLGFEESKRYFIAFQNPAEARGTGGLIGAFAVVRFDKGQIKFEEVGSNYLLQLQDELPIDMPAEFDRLYGDDPAWWPNSNMSPHFPYAAQIWLALWEKQSGQKLDGLMALDPFVLKRILYRTGPIVVNGREISSKNVVRVTLLDSYLEYADDNVARKEFIVEVIKKVMEKALDSDQDKLELAYAFASSIKDNRFLFYSSNDNEQAIVKNSKISGALDSSGLNDFRLVLINTAGNKMDFFIDRSLKLESLTCRESRIARATFTISNLASPSQELPDNYYGRQDLENPENRDNSTSLAVLLFGPPDAKLVAAEDTETKGPAGHLKRELGRDVLVLSLDLKAGQSRNFLAEFKGVRNDFTATVQPLVRGQRTEVIDKCL